MHTDCLGSNASTPSNALLYTIWQLDLNQAIQYCLPALCMDPPPKAALTIATQKNEDHGNVQDFHVW